MVPSAPMDTMMHACVYVFVCVCDVYVCVCVYVYVWMCECMCVCVYVCVMYNNGVHSPPPPPLIASKVKKSFLTVCPFEFASRQTSYYLVLSIDWARTSNVEAKVSTQGMHLKGRGTLHTPRVRAIAGVQVRIGEHGALFEQPDFYNIRV